VINNQKKYFIFKRCVKQIALLRSKSEIKAGINVLPQKDQKLTKSFTKASSNNFCDSFVSIVVQQNQEYNFFVQFVLHTFKRFSSLIYSISTGFNY